MSHPIGPYKITRGPAWHEGWYPYLDVRAKVLTRNAPGTGLRATDLTDSMVAQWLTSKLMDLQTEMSEAYPAMHIEFSITMPKPGDSRR